MILSTIQSISADVRCFHSLLSEMQLHCTTGRPTAAVPTAVWSDTTLRAIEMVSFCKFVCRRWLHLRFFRILIIIRTRTFHRRLLAQRKWCQGVNEFKDFWRNATFEQLKKAVFWKTDNLRKTIELRWYFLMATLSSAEQFEGFVCTYLDFPTLSVWPKKRYENCTNLQRRRRLYLSRVVCIF